jgi:hypothetical protein
MRDHSSERERERERERRRDRRRASTNRSPSPAEPRTRSIIEQGVALAAAELFKKQFPRLDLPDLDRHLKDALARPDKRAKSQTPAASVAERGKKTSERQTVERQSSPLPAIRTHEPGAQRPAQPGLLSPLSPSHHRQAPATTPAWPRDQGPPTDHGHRRQSDVEPDTTVTRLPTCRRDTPARGHADWLTLPDAPNLYVCPSCFAGAIASTAHGQRFVAAAGDAAAEEIACDFGASPWYRIAWLLTLKQRRRDLAAFAAISAISAREKACLGRHATRQKWFTLPNAAGTQPVPDLFVCAACTATIEAILPPLAGLFVRADAAPDVPRACDLRFDSPHFVHYFDALELLAEDEAAEAAARADGSARRRAPPDTRDLEALARLCAAQCPGEADVCAGAWRTLAAPREPLLADFAVCPACYASKVRGEARRAPHGPAALVRREPVILAGRTRCALRSEAMSAAWRQAVAADDLAPLVAAVARQRSEELRLR